jgi:hypothetical protein
MPLSDLYRRQAALLVRVIPQVAAEACFALKGGTAINLFWRDMPRLSVDIDLTYLPVADRAASLAAIDQAMRRISASIARGTPGARVTPMALQGEDCITRLLVRADGVQIKIEVTPVLRGCVYEPSTRSVSARVEDEFGFAEMQVVSFADLYAGKRSPHSTASIRATCSTPGICWPTKASRTISVRPSLSTSSATTGRWPRCSLQRGAISRRSLPGDSMA